MQPVQQVRDQGVASPALHAGVERDATRLARFHERVAACRVALERWYQQHGQSSNCRVESDLELPGEKLGVARESQRDAGEEALESSLSASFEGAEEALSRRAARATWTASHAPQRSAEARRLHPLHGHAPEDDARQAAATHDW